uniref:Transposase-associated domain-containing protein n=1 Tax=Brassica oleracea TaxID=3712 RepID=A0A3P6G6T7_BRAOL|nr:unnamed protein product [Brassica oleracea]
MEEELRDKKARKNYYNMLDFVANAQQGIPKLCPYGSIMKETVDEEDTGKIFCPCRKCNNSKLANHENMYFTRGYTFHTYEYGKQTATSNYGIWFHLMMSTNIHNILGIRDDVHDTQAHHRLKYDLIENIWNKFGDS